MSAKGTCDSKVLDWCWSAGVAAPGPRTSVCRPRVHLIEITLDEGRGDLQECRHELVLMTPCSSFIDAALSSGIDILRFVAGQSGRQRLCCTLARELGVLDGHPVHIRKMNISAMADASLAAMAGVTAADHERISKFCLVRS